MILSTLDAVAQAMSEYFRSSYSDNAPEINISNLVNSDGKSAIDENTDQIVITLINIQEERNVNNGRTSNLSAPYFINLYLLITSFAGKESKYTDSLRYISSVLSFFQHNHVLSHQNAKLPDEISQLVFDFINHETQQVQYIFSMLGAKYSPSLIFKARLIPVEEKANMGSFPRIGGINF
ncbi:DUF4255 domain-containing protein [uncultured Microscilla sp.]|uniref:DUF4255 domain-containing protein n=1 Tax=uncultured Microscilla sp. TaxID=432653 RepID=UPI00261FADE4|nr:DUF4255 domain-containing protein [uncultured Microscilla sp.]